MEKQNSLNGVSFYDALVSGISNVISKYEHLNKINVFPVPDGDTGTNLLFTLKPIAELNRDEISLNLENSLKIISNTSINSARGNSGTILAQYFVGLAEGASNIEELKPSNINRILQSGFQFAFDAMSDPKEGTVITVMRDIAKHQFDDKNNLSIEDVFDIIYQISSKSLENTPNQMKILKDSGVVDAGAQGLVDLIEGMLYYIKNNKIISPDSINKKISSDEVSSIQSHDYSSFQYCTECVINGNDINRVELRERLNDLGDSFIVAGNKSTIKIHIHTDSPENIFKICSEYGKLLNQKADDMYVQVHTASESKNKIAILTDSGCDIQHDNHNPNIHIVPVRYSFGEKEYLDKTSQSTDEFYNELKNNPIHPKTSQPPTGDFITKLNYLSSHFDSVVAIHIPRLLSGTLQSCENAVKMIENYKITVLDSFSASVGLGLIIQSASELAEDIETHDELVKKIEKLIDETEMYLIINDIKYAVKGGRVPKFAGTIAKTLNIHTILTTNKIGKLKIASVAFGAKNLHEKITKFVIKKINKNYKYKFSVAHSNSINQGNKIVNILQNDIQNLETIDLLDMGTALGVHAGPGSFIIAFQKVSEK